MPTGEALGPYVVLAKLGEGGAGVVVRARHVPTGREVAIKRLRADRAADERAVARFAREVSLVQRVRHPGVVEVRGVEVLASEVLLVMELVDGFSLEELLLRDGPFPVPQAVRIAEAVAEALHHCHGLGVLHRDVKPGNILLRRDGRPVLVDFGLSKSLDLPRLTATGAQLGTLGFCAPEQLHDASSATARSEVYALGATLYALLAGAPPFRGRSDREVIQLVLQGRWASPSKLRPEVGSALDAVCARAMALRPEDRYADARALAEDLARVRRGEAPLAAGAVRAGAVEALGALMAVELEPEGAVSSDVQFIDVGASSAIEDLPAPTETPAQLEAAAREAFGRGDDPACVAALDRALQLAPERSDLWSMRGVARRRLGDDRGALLDHEEALSRDPRHVGSLVGRAMIRARHRDHVRATEDLERALALLSPDSPRRPKVEQALARSRAALGSSVIRGLQVRPREGG